MYDSEESLALNESDKITIILTLLFGCSLNRSFQQNFTSICIIDYSEASRQNI